MQDNTKEPNKKRWNLKDLCLIVSRFINDNSTFYVCHVYIETCYIAHLASAISSNFPSLSTPNLQKKTESRSVQSSPSYFFGSTLTDTFYYNV